jgi:putative flippase GtrA
MKEKIKKISNHHHTKTTVKYGIVSVIATIIDFVVLNGGIKVLELAPQVAKTLAFVTATLAVFRLQQRWVFRADPDSSTKKQIIQYLAASIAGFLASQGAITVSNAVWPGNLIYINVANLVGFGSVWVAKLVFFKLVVFKSPAPVATTDSVVGEPASSGVAEAEPNEQNSAELSKEGVAGSEAVA